VVSRQDFCDKLAALGARLLNPLDKGRRLSLEAFVVLGEAFVRVDKKTIDVESVIALGERLLFADKRALKDFVDTFVATPNALRWKLLGQSALRRKRLGPAQRRALDTLGRSPDLLGPARGRFDERLHTEVIAWAVDPRRRHLGGRPLIALMRRLELLRSKLGHDNPLPFATPVPPTTVVTPELLIHPYGRVDICVESDAMLLLIEAKILAAEGKSQLTRYRSAAAQRARGRPWAVLFLTSDGEQKPSVAVPHMTLRELLADWLPVAADGESGEHDYLRSYLASIARVVDVGAPGDFDDWDFYTRRRALDLLDMGI
jgi:PD-(D/E)XK nuclease superfamily